VGRYTGYRLLSSSGSGVSEVMTILQTIRRHREIGGTGMNRRNAEYIMRFNPDLPFRSWTTSSKQNIGEAHQISTPRVCTM